MLYNVSQGETEAKRLNNLKKEELKQRQTAFEQEKNRKNPMNIFIQSQYKSSMWQHAMYYITFNARADKLKCLFINSLWSR